MEKFSAKEQIQLTEVYRRLGYFKNWNLDESLLMLAFPSEVKELKQKDILKPSYNEKARVLNWYTLTEKGKELFKEHSKQSKLTHQEAQDLFDGKRLIDFNKTLTLSA